MRKTEIRLSLGLFVLAVTMGVMGKLGYDRIERLSAQVFSLEQQNEALRTEAIAVANAHFDEFAASHTFKKLKVQTIDIVDASERTRIQLAGATRGMEDVASVRLWDQNKKARGAIWSSSDAGGIRMDGLVKVNGSVEVEADDTGGVKLTNGGRVIAGMIHHGPLNGSMIFSSNPQTQDFAYMISGNSGMAFEMARNDKVVLQFLQPTTGPVKTWTSDPALARAWNVAGHAATASWVLSKLTRRRAR
ncbi:MAG: hypothetical protein CL807_06110 [Citromicrobium sp.]|nr:hypothetical protein [Citromicrobium sp.]MAO95282.1 hypothetical protein [Citromicrobium sp.]MAS84877.1 hypothetical protein [Erythrobacteraceae bacterium]MBD76457.1 hypothetical protein [Citromicrobium sp.]MBT46939.1 hypothetical protein [Citromicrobium sp.]